MVRDPKEEGLGNPIAGVGTTLALE
jgi:hypothetical protein